MKFKRLIAASVAVLLVTFALTPPASASVIYPTLHVNGVTMGPEAMATLYYDTTYVSLRIVSEALDSSAVVDWFDGAARVQIGNTTLTARPGDSYVTINGEIVSVPYGVKMTQWRTLIPVRTLAQAFNATVYWSTEINGVVMKSNEEAPPSYSDDDLYWLSRIISAESRGEPMDGKIAVGNVVLNRVASPDFPNTIYGVIFDARWGGQFEPARNGTIYQTPTQESVEAARRCLEGANVVGDCLYFFAPALAQNFWVAENRKYVTTIGCHSFYL